ISTLSPPGNSSSTRPSGASNRTIPGTEDEILNRGSGRHHSAVSRVKTSNASAGSVATIVETRTRGLLSSTAPPRWGCVPASPGRVGVGIEGVELTRPEPFDFSQPAVQFSERFGPQAEDAQPRVFFDIGRLHEAGSMQQPEMPARGRCAHAQSCGNLAGALRFASQQLDNAATRGIGQRGKRPVDVGARQRAGRHYDCSGCAKIHRCPSGSIARYIRVPSRLAGSEVTVAPFVRARAKWASTSSTVQYVCPCTSGRPSGLRPNPSNSDASMTEPS